MTTSPLAQAVGDLEEDKAVVLVQDKLAKGETALDILEELQEGMTIVGQRFEDCEYYLSELIYAADIFKKAGAPLQEELKNSVQSSYGTLVLGTVKNDIHDFGKDIVATVLSSNGIKVIDLGVNVEHQAFVDAVKESGATLVGMSCLLTTVFDDMRDAIAALKDAGLRDQVTVLDRRGRGSGHLRLRRRRLLLQDRSRRGRIREASAGGELTAGEHSNSQGGGPAGGAGALGGFAPPPIFFERMQRLQTAVACGTPDRVPLSLVMDLFAAKIMGVSYPDFVSSVDIAGQTMLDAMEKLGDVDSIQFPTNAPDVLGLLWLAPVKLPGRDLPEHSLWQMDEQVRIQREDYDKILEMGWSAWFGQYVGKHLGAAAAAGQALMEGGPRWTMEYMKKGYVVFSPLTVDHPFEHIAGGRTVKEFTLDLFQIPDKVQAVLDVIMAEKREQTRGFLRAVGQPGLGYWVGSWRTAPEFLSPRLWDRFVWPYMKELVEIVAEEGGTPVLHYDANWDREIERLKDLPARRCVLELDGKTDIFRAKKILAGHMCLLGDVHPAMLTLGTVADVKAYCNRLLDEVGPDGFIMAMGCAIPPDAKFDNVKAMVDSVHR